ncbi:MAG: response regulator, partial [Candidatus Hydrogenedentes bacterium]|nr:response regulator [Candidatus Hydrogenedentota bacterium]
MARLLVVEDEAVLRLTFKQFLEEKGHVVWTAADFDEAVAWLDETPIDVVISDIILGGKTGVDLLRTVDERGLDCMVIMITGNPSVETASQAVRLGAFDYLTKPVTDNDLERVVRLALDKKKVAAERDAYRRELDVIFNSVNAGIITVDKDLCVRQVNDAARAMFKLSSERSNGCAFEDLLPASLGQVREALQRTLMTQERETDIRLEVSMNSDPDKVLAITTAPLVGSRGAQEGAILIARDITRLTLLERELQEKHRYRDMVGKSRQLREIFTLIEDLAETDSTVLIYGESGTGKELVAEAIHESSTRSRGPFIRVNCAALSE